jgi:nucleolar complex protein 3
MTKKFKSRIKERNKSSGKSKQQQNRDGHDGAENDGQQVPKRLVQRKLKLPSLDEMTPDWIAEISESILESPETAFSSVMEQENGDRNEAAAPSATASKMRQLLAAATSSSAGSPPQDGDPKGHHHRSDVARLAILSLLAIFQDILPSYRIRLPSVKEMAVKVSRATKKLWDYERALLGHYQEYLQILERCWNAEKERSSPSAVAVTAVLCLCELAKSAFHFNFRSNLLSAVVRPMNHSVEQVSEACCQAIRHVFSADSQGEVALEAVRQVAKMIRDKHFKVQPRVLRTFLSLPLRVHVDEAQAAKIAAAVNSRKRKRDRETAAIEAELKESQATADKIVLAQAQSDALQAVTLTYFRILKSENHHEERLLPAALEGLAKFSHLINMETVLDLLDLLKGLLSKADALPLDAALNCVLTAFSTLAGPGKELQIDVKEYITPLYSQLKRFVCESACEHTDLLLECMDAAFVKRRELSTVRVSAFVKQIWSITLQTPPSTSVPLMAFSRQLIQRYPSAQQLLENEQDVITSGQYDPRVTDPEHSNPLATSGWELALLRFHYHPAVATHAAAAASAKLLELPGEGSGRLRSQIVREQGELFISLVRNAKSHPLDPSKGQKGDGGGRSKRHRARFVTPRHAECIYIEDDPVRSEGSTDTIVAW